VTAALDPFGDAFAPDLSSDFGVGLGLLVVVVGSGLGGWLGVFDAVQAQQLVQGLLADELGDFGNESAGIALGGEFKRDRSKTIDMRINEEDVSES